MKTIKSCLTVVVIIIATAFASAFADASSLPILIDTGYGISTTNGGVEVTVVMEVANVAPTNLQALLTLNVGGRTNAVGVAVDDEYNLSGIAEGNYPWGSWKNFANYPADGGVHRIAFGYAGTAWSVKGSGGYRGTKIVIDGTNVYANSGLVYGSEVVKRIALGGGFDKPERTLAGAQVKAYSVYPVALSETEMKALTKKPVVLAKDFSYEPKAGAAPEGWMTSFGGKEEPFQKTGSFRIGPDGECVSVVSSGQHPWKGLESKSNYTMALYADLSQVARDVTGRHLVMLGSKNNGINQGLTMLSDGNVNLVEGNKATIRSTAVKTSTAPVAGYHLFVWTQSAAEGATLYVDGEKIGTDASMTSATSVGFQLGSLHGGTWSNYAQAYGMAVAGVYGWDRVLTDAQIATLAEQYPAVEGGVEATEIDETITGTLTLADGDALAAGAYGCSLAVAAGATVDVMAEGEVGRSAQLLEAKSIVIPDGANVTVNGVTRKLVNSGTALSVFEPVAEVAGVKYAAFADAVAAAGNGGTITLLVPQKEIADEIAAAAVTLTQVEGDTYTVTFTMTEGSSLVISEIMPKPTDAQDRGTLCGMDPNGLESGWVEVENTSDAWADLKDYKFIRVNRSKANSKGDFGNFPSRLIAPHAKAVFWTSERYANSADMTVSAFETPVESKKPAVFGDMVVWPDKVNPKKFAFVRLYYAPGGTEQSIVDTVVIPSDLPEGASIIVAPVEAGEATVRYICEAPTRGKENPPVEGLVKLGPNVGPLYEISSQKKHDSANEFGEVAPAKVGEDYAIAFALNPTMHPTEVQTKKGKFRDEDAITDVKIIYRTKLDDKTLVTNGVDMTATWDKDDQGYTYSTAIPHEAFDTIGAGQLIQWKFLITDASGNEWTSPSFHNPDDGYEWYGTITEPGALNSEKLPTWHMFVDDASKAQMDTDADKQTLPYNARVAIYDASTSNYYDYVRIDLRGNTSAHFTKKSHGLRFAKAHPLTMTDVVTGEPIEEIRKTSLISEVGDPTYLRQLTAFWLFNRLGSSAPFDFPVRCNLNGEFYQMAFNSERFTDELIEDVYGFDKYGYSWKNVGTLASGGGTSAGSIEKKTPDDEDEKNVTVLENDLRKPLKDLGVDNVEGTTKAAWTGADTTGLDNTALAKFVVEKFDLPAWLNYLAAARITQETDDVWANISIYYDKPDMIEGRRGTGTWKPLAYDMNLSFGQWHCADLGQKLGLMSTNDWFKSHPFYGGNRIRCWSNNELTGVKNEGNRGIEAVWQTAKFRRLYLRRLRTLMDQELKAPGTPEEDVPFMVEMRKLAALMADDAVADRAKYPAASANIGAINVWKNFPASVDAGLQDIWDNYVVPRRKHLYVTHAATNTAWAVGYGSRLNAGIPEAQSPASELVGVVTIANLTDLTPEMAEALDVDRQFYDEDVLVISNASTVAVDLSNWKLKYSVDYTLPSGTVVDANDCLYVVRDRRAYVAALADAGKVTDQIVVGNAAFNVNGAIALVADDGTVIVSKVPRTDERDYLRLHAFCGNTSEGGGDEGEWFVLTNISDTVTLNLEGVTACFLKKDDPHDTTDHCHVTFTFDKEKDGLLAPGAAIRFDQEDFADKGWVKIQNNKQVINLYDKYGSTAQHLEVTQKEFDLAYGHGAYLACDSTEQSVTKKKYWHQVFDVAVGTTVYERKDDIAALFADGVTLRFGVPVTVDKAAQTVTFDDATVIAIPPAQWTITVGTHKDYANETDVTLATAVVPVTPGETKSYETEDEATNAAAKAVVAMPSEVANATNEQGKAVISAADYNALFDVKAVQTATSTWELKPELKESVSNEVQVAVDAATSNVTLMATMTTETPTAKVTTQAGLFYGMAAADAVDSVGEAVIPFERWVLGTGKEQELRSDRPSAAAGFYQIRVQIEPPKKATPVPYPY